MKLAFPPLTPAHYPFVARWLAAPHVSQWWRSPAPTAAAVAEHYRGRREGGDSTHVHLIELDGVPVGLIQCYRHADDPEWDRAVGIPDVAGIDYLIGEPSACGRGVGSAAIRAFAAATLDRYPDVTGVVAVPLTANRASCRALEKAGFTHVEDRDVPSPDPADAGLNSVYLLPR
ncbi:GNAT family N-acetyltransferase [Streptomyces sp. ICBB 8177]|uniref:GNAT family N-acetyltransferase n=1 Tax=Streptomyces sp. ICBB 8177 TaxID=563922 RepID=UPI000D67F305|nr:GNAT family N-acetyltransferase [Streptomyces sp. ICBB 8177]PWI45999.1 GNAT family N-acetyltransferase [Streptomyces sp. ICBB 8177]